MRSLTYRWKWMSGFGAGACDSMLHDDFGIYVSGERRFRGIPFCFPFVSLLSLSPFVFFLIFFPGFGCRRKKGGEPGVLTSEAVVTSCYCGSHMNVVRIHRSPEWANIASPRVHCRPVSIRYFLFLFRRIVIILF